MLTKRLTLFGILVAMIVLLAITAAPPQAAKAQERSQTSVTETQACLSCHENLYFLYDTGKWYCISERAGDCTSCHEGNPWALQEDEAHAGLVAHPTRNDGEKCQQCHQQDAPAHVEKFDKIAGIKLVEVESPYQAHLASEETINSFPSNLSEMYPEQVHPWLIAGAVFAFGTWLALVTWTSHR